MSDADGPALWAHATMMSHIYESFKNEPDVAEKCLWKDTALINAQLVLTYDSEEGEQTWTDLAQVPEIIQCFGTAASIFALVDNRDKIVECHQRMTAHINRLMPAIPDIKDWLC